MTISLVHLAPGEVFDLGPLNQGGNLTDQIKKIAASSSFE